MESSTQPRTRPRPNPAHDSDNNNTNTDDERDNPEDLAFHRPIHDRYIMDQSLRILDFPATIDVIDTKAYYNCWSLRKLRVPATVHSIGASAFANCWELRSVELPERIESSTADGTLGGWDRFLLKLALCFHEDSSVAIQDAAFNLCHSLRNIALPHGTSDLEVPATAFVGCAELKKHFPHEEDLMHALTHRFDGLPIHKICYYQSHYPLETTIRNLEQAIVTERRKRQHEARHNRCRDGCGGVFGMHHKLPHPVLPPTFILSGLGQASRLELIDTLDSQGQQDSFGMTPLHILGCSVHQSLDLYKILIDYSPTDLIHKDKWGDHPLLYAYQTHAPLESVLLLLRSQRRLFPDHQIEWVAMIKKMCFNHASVESIQTVFRSHEIILAEEGGSDERINLGLCIQDRLWFWKLVSFPVLQLLVQYQEAHFPNEIIQWDPLVDRLSASPHWLKDLSMDKIVFLLQKGTAQRLALLGLDSWKQEVTAKINSVDRSSQHQTFAEKRAFVKSVMAVLKQKELREMAALLELAMWKKEWSNHQSTGANEQEGDDDAIDNRRKESLVNSGAAIAVSNVLPLISKSPKLAIQRRNRSSSKTRRRRRRRIAEYVMHEI